MPLFSKNGSIPKPQTDGTDGWVLVPDEPPCPEGKEVVWLNWSWVVRDPQPVSKLGYCWKWNHSTMEWIEYQLQSNITEEIITLSSDILNTITTEQPTTLTTEQIGL